MVPQSYVRDSPASGATPAEPMRTPLELLCVVGPDGTPPCRPRGAGPKHRGHAEMELSALLPGCQLSGDPTAGPAKVFSPGATPEAIDHAASRLVASELWCSIAERGSVVELSRGAVSCSHTDPRQRCRRKHHSRAVRLASGRTLPAALIQFNLFCLTCT